VAVPAQRGIDATEDRLGRVQPRDHAGRLLDDPRPSRRAGRHERRGGDVAGADVLRQRPVDQLLH
jgi:hypothetical protein